jgi:hypothetical protein
LHRSRIEIALAGAALAAVLLMPGCGNKVDTPSDVPSTNTPATTVPAAGPAIDAKLTFDQLALESPVSKVTKGGLAFLSFAFADRDGKVYKCVLPQAQSQGSYTCDQWVRTFIVYKLPQVIAQKKTTKKGPTNVNGFPFISPKPQPVAGETPQANNQQMPKMPNMPAASSSGPAQGGSTPPPNAVMPMGARGPVGMTPPR